MIPIQEDVIKVHGPTPKNKSLIAIPRAPTPRPNIGPPTIPLRMDRKAAGLTFGGPPANTILVAATMLAKQTSRAIVFVRSVCAL